MKKVLFSFLLMSLMAVGVQAQKASCSKSCTTKPGAAASVNTTPESSTAAAKLASMDATIESRTCPVSGTVSYVRKETAKNGSVAYVDVNYDAATNSFVNVSPVKMENKSSCGPNATSAAGKSCCSSKAAASKSCCAGKGKATSAAVTTKPVEGQPVKTSGSIKN